MRTTTGTRIIAVHADGQWQVDDLSVRNRDKRNFVICCGHGDWSGFDTLDALLARPLPIRASYYFHIGCRHGAHRSSNGLPRPAEDADLLIGLVRVYHPASPGEKRELPITAPRVELFAGQIRSAIEAAKGGTTPDKVLQLRLDRGDVGGITTLLNEAWFGVPESTDCWRVPGFKEAVRLLEDPPEDD